MLPVYCRYFVACASALFSLTQVSAAQQAINLAGVVADAKNVPIPAATIRLFSLEPAPAAETITDVDGTFSFSDLPPGTYRIVVEMPGFQKLTRENIRLGDTASSPLKLIMQRPEPARSPGAIGGPLQQRRLPQQGGAVLGSPRAFEEVDMGDFREENGLQTSQSSSETPIMQSQAREDNSDLLVISGSSTANFSAGDMNDPGFRDRMMEMADRMGFGGFAPMMGGREGGLQGGPSGAPSGGPPGMGAGGRLEGGGPGFFGRGGARGGRNRQPRVNGSIYSNYRNSFLNARSYSLTGQEVAKPLQIQNSFGVSVGGALPWHPKQAGQTGTRPMGPRGFQQAGMWFFSYDGTRNRNPYDILTTVPTALERSGDFSQTVLRSGAAAGNTIRIYDPQSLGQLPFPGNQIPASRLNSASTALMAYIPLPNLPGSVQNYTMQRGLPNTSNNFTARLNTPLTAKTNVFINYGHRSGESVSSQIFPGLDTTRTNSAQNFGFGGMHRFQPRFLMNFRLSLNRVKTLGSNPFSFKDNVAERLGIRGVSKDPINYGIPAISFDNYGGLAISNPSLLRTQTFAVGGGTTKIGKKHTITAGGDLSWNQRNSQTDPNARGTFDFTGFTTSAFNAQGKPIPGTGYDFADFLLGLPNATSRRYGSSLNYLRNRSLNLFVSDNWRARSNLTLNLGVRYEYIQPFYEKYDRLVSLDPAPGFTAVSQVFPGRVGAYSGYFPRSLVFGDKNNFAPRIGVAWKRKANSKWVFRTGYGLFYNPSVYPYIAGQLIGQPPYAINQNLLTSITNPLTLQSGFPSNPDVTILNSYAINPHYRIGYIQSWNLTLQTQLFKLYTLEAGYYGSKGTHLDVLRAPNRAPQGSPPATTEGDRQIANAGNFVYQTSEANSVMHSMRIRLVRRFSQGFRIENSYTFGKSIDNASGVGGGSLIVIQNEKDLLAERSLSSFDQRHNLQSNFSFDLPFGERRKYLSAAGPVIGQLISRWTIVGSFQLASGMPLTPRLLGNVSNNSGTGSNYSERPDATGLPISLPGDQRNTLHYFNTAAFAIPAPGKFGNAARYAIPGPGTILLNLTLNKSFRIDENNRRVDLRWQVTNLLNHPNLSGLGTAINTNNFGRVTSVRSMRQMEINLRINF